MALGMTETFGPYSWGSGGTGPIAPIESVQPGLEVRVVDPDLEPVADGETGGDLPARPLRDARLPPPATQLGLRRRRAGPHR